MDTHGALQRTTPDIPCPPFALSGDRFPPTDPGSVVFPLQLLPPLLPLEVPFYPTLDSEKDTKFPNFPPHHPLMPLTDLPAILLLHMSTRK